MTALPPKLEAVVNMFQKSPKAFRLQALLDFSKRVPPLPERLQADHDQMEQVHECQSPFFLFSEVEDGKVHLYFDAPQEAPTVRGFAGILLEGLQGATPEEILNVPDDFYFNMGLSELITPMRLRGMGAILTRLKKQLSA
ncbi:SufE family protein [Deinococcus cellulosilyticus]|uniref:Cysteine desufuration protein SufE n=1 Tax=Deinococcus cellulosilyticus (strain DSM 18568 / NBRC 106333 / KACC 11606 / 5516J-15) TaxID=1223518 RepID=A0A511N5M8_DEIC1|nr:SufE family protein [Deinococcus cellulosilyticus]GEM47778.1 cysteine desufuration protein SufE [Deinococcus cellulosilyticus NBRC 106333 = KACC 11606]